jgi:hypothetical protein
VEQVFFFEAQVFFFNEALWSKCFFLLWSKCFFFVWRIFFWKGLPDVEEVSIESLFKVIAIDVPDAGSPASLLIFSTSGTEFTNL